MNRLGLTVLMLHLLSPVAAAAEGINLSWDDCGSAGVSFKVFACDDNDGPPDVFVASFSPPPGIDSLGGAQASIDIRSSDGSGFLPDWWQHLGTFQQGLACRDSNGLGIDVDFGDVCQNPFVARAPDLAGVRYRTDFGGPDRARLDVSIGYLAVGGGPLPPGPEYYAFRILMSHYRSTGADSCAGCSVPACIVLNSLQLFDRADLIDNPEILDPLERNHITWQSVLADCPLSTPARKSTWGQIKSLYR